MYTYIRYMYVCYTRTVVVVGASKIGIVACTECRERSVKRIVLESSK